MRKRSSIMMNFAIELSSLSKCEERGVAAVITDESMAQVLSIGINGGPKGLADCLCSIEGKYGCIHAEINALIKCNDNADNKRMFITLAPCKQCAAAIVNSPGRISTVYYHESWKEDAGILLLKAAGIQVLKL